MKRQSVLVLVMVFSITVLGICEYVFADLYSTSGSIVAWGLNDYGQCNVPMGNNFYDIAAGSRHGLALTPVPSAVILGGLGLGFSGWLLKRKGMMI